MARFHCRPVPNVVWVNCSAWWTTDPLDVANDLADRPNPTTDRRQRVKPSRRYCDAAIVPRDRRRSEHAQVGLRPVPVGKIKSFGAFGPKYEVREALRALDDGDWMVEVMLVETGEKAEYRLTHVNDDPEAR